MRTITGRLGVLILACVFVAGCGSVEGNINTGDDFDNDEVVEALTKELKRETKTDFTVTCPKNIKMKKGATFECTAMDAEDHEVKVVSTQTDGKGNFDWDLVALFDRDEVVKVITDGLKQETKVDFVVTCPKEIELEKGGTFDCAAVDPDDYEVTIRSTQSDDEGSFDWEIVEDYDAAGLAASITSGLKQQTKIDYTVTCPKGVEMHEGATYECTAVDPDGNEETIATETNSDGEVDWKLVEE